MRRCLTPHIVCVMLTDYMTYLISMLLLVSCMSTYDPLLYFARFCAGSTPKIATKQYRNLANFITITAPCFEYLTG